MCKVQECIGKPTRRGMCEKHYRRFMKSGDPLIVSVIRAGHKEVSKWLLDSFSTETNDCIAFPFSIKRNGYGQVWLNGKKQYPHRVACEFKNGKQSLPTDHAAHSCNNRACVNPKHLSWKSPLENMRDKIVHGTNVYGERHYKSKLNEKYVRFIRNTGEPQYDAKMAAAFGVATSTIRSVRIGKTWKHVDV